MSLLAGACMHTCAREFGAFAGWGEYVHKGGCCCSLHAQLLLLPFSSILPLQLACAAAFFTFFVYLKCSSLRCLLVHATHVCMHASNAYKQGKHGRKQYMHACANAYLHAKNACMRVRLLQDCRFSSGKLEHELSMCYPSLSFEQRAHLISHYGFISRDVVDLAKKEALMEPLVEGLPYLKGEVVFACRFASLLFCFALFSAALNTHSFRDTESTNSCLLHTNKEGQKTDPQRQRYRDRWR